MRKLLLLSLLISNFTLLAQIPCAGGIAAGNENYPCNGIDLQSEFTLAQLGASSGNDSWGWTDPLDGKEYAIVGLNNSTFFIDITDPINPRRLGRLMSYNGTSTLWRDVKTYNNHAYVVSEATNHGMQVFDLTRLRGLSTNANRTFNADARLDGGMDDSHNIIINEDSGYAYVLGSKLYSGGPVFINLANPASPVIEGGYSADGYTHDAQVVMYDGPDQDYQGREIFIGSNANEIVVLDVTDKSNVQQISTLSYPNTGYTHQGWFTYDKKYFILGDETDEQSFGFNTKTVIFDLSDLDSPSIHFNYYGPTSAADHNGYVKGNKFYQASYSAGMRVINLDNIGAGAPSITETEFFDTYRISNSSAFNGAWNVYPYFKSGNLIISNYNKGFFVVKDPNYDAVDPVAVCQNIVVSLDATGKATITAAMLDGGSTDNVGVWAMELDKTEFTCADLGANSVTFTVLDNNENASSCTATVTVQADTTTYTGTWDNGAPDAGKRAVFTSSYDTAAGDVEACLCEVGALSTVTVRAGKYLNIGNDITVDGTLIVEHQGSVVQTNDAASVTNNGTINVQLTTPSLNARDFMIMGSPMDADTDAMFTAYQVLNHTTTNFSPFPGIPGVNFQDVDSNDWTNHTGTLNPGEGYLIRPSYTSGGSYNYEYNQGTLNNGIVTYAADFNANKNSSPNVIANPYASAIDADAIINGNAIIDEVYFWEHLTTPSTSIPGPLSENFSMEDISTYNLLGGTPAANDPGTSTTPNGVISTGQGFGIKANAAGTVTFNNAARLTTGNTTLRAPQQKDRIWITVRESEFNMGSTALVGFTDVTTAGIDASFDTERLGTVVSMYSHLDDGSQELGIQAREAFNSEMKIPMGFSTMIEQDLHYTISIANLDGSNLDEIIVYLVDNLEETITNLSQDSYSFTSSAGTFNNRFTLEFERVLSTSTIESELESVTAFPNPTDDILTIASPNATINSIEVFDVRGRLIDEVSLENNNSHQLDVSKLLPAIYFVKISTESGSITKRIIKS